MSTSGLPVSPMAIDAGGDPRSDIFTRLLKNRVVMLGTDVNDDIANQICAQLLYLEGEDANADIWLYINSPGGSVTAGMAIYDTMQFIKPDVQTIVMGQACSMGSLLAQAGAAGKRKMLPNARHMIHQPSGGARGMQSDIAIQFKEITQMKKMLTLQTLWSGEGDNKKREDFPMYDYEPGKIFDINIVHVLKLFINLRELMEIKN